MTATSQDAPLPAAASVVVIGGGVMGLSSAYHLALAGVTDVVLVERGSLGEGSSSRAAGGLRAQFSDEVNIRLAMRSMETFRTFADDFDQDIDYHEVGYLFLLDNEADVATFTANVALQNSLGVPSRIIDVAEARRLSPLIETDGLLAAAFSPTDGHCTPESVVLGLARAARRAGVRIVTSCAATGVEVSDGAVVAVQTDRGRIGTTGVVCAAGAWSAVVGEWAGVDLPIRPLRRQIAVSDPVEGLDPDTPFTIDFSTSFYFHREGRGLLLGMPESADVWDHDLSRSLGWMDHLAAAIAHRIPRIGDIGIDQGWAGLYEMTPDHNGLIGAADEVSGFLYAAGFSGHGFMMGPAVGEVIRDLYLGRTPSIDVTALSASRFGGAGHRREHNFI